MPPLVEPLLAELEQEAKTTRRVLERLPDEKFDWKPHEKSMSLGKLATHVATLPGGIAKSLGLDRLEVGTGRSAPELKSKAEVITAFEDNVMEAKRAIGDLDDQAAQGMWGLSMGGKDIFVMPRLGVIRYVLLNHWYHHRGQLTVYLRLLDVPVPSIYGPSADENPFA